MDKAVEVKEEPEKVIKMSCLPELPTCVVGELKSHGIFTLEDVVNKKGVQDCIEHLNLYILQLSSSETPIESDMVKDAGFITSLIRSEVERIQMKVAEMLIQYVKHVKVDIELDSKHGGIKGSRSLFEFYESIHTDLCLHLLPNVDANESCWKFLCNLLSVCSSEDVFISIVKLFQNTVNDILSESKPKDDADSLIKNLPVDKARVVIGIMKTLLSITKAFGSPPAPINILCELSVAVIRATNIHLCRLYSYNILAFLLRHMVDEEAINKMLTGLDETQTKHVGVLIKESNHLKDVCNWNFKYGNPVRSDVEPLVSSAGTDKHTPVVKHTDLNKRERDKEVNSVDLKKKKRGENTKINKKSDFLNEWVKKISSKLENSESAGKKNIDRNAWKGKTEALQTAINDIERHKENLDITAIAPQIVSILEIVFKFESAIPVLINGLTLFTVLMRKCDPDLITITKCQGLADLIFDRLKESNKKLREVATMAVLEILINCKSNVIVDSIRKALNHKSPSCRETICNILNGKSITIGSDTKLLSKLEECSNSIKPFLAPLLSDKILKVKNAANLTMKVLNDFSIINQYIPTATVQRLPAIKENDSKCPPNEGNTVDKVENDDSRPNLKRKFFKNPEDSVISDDAESVPLDEKKQNTAVPSPKQPTPIQIDPTPQSVSPIEEVQTFVPAKVVNDNKTPIKRSTVENRLVDKIGVDILDKIAQRGIGVNSLSEGLCGLCVWMNNNPDVAKSVDYYLLKFVGENTDGFRISNNNANLYLGVFFEHLIGLGVTQNAFDELLSILINMGTLENNFIFNAILCGKNDGVALKMFEIVDERSEIILKLLKNTIRSTGILINEIIFDKVVNYCSYFIEGNVDHYKQIAIEVLTTLEQKYSLERIIKVIDPKYKHVIRNFNAKLQSYDTSQKIKKNLKLAYLDASIRFEKDVSKDLYLCMFQDGSPDNRKRACVFWRLFIQKNNEKCSLMLFQENNIRYELVAWLCHTLFEDRMGKAVLDVLCLISTILKDNNSMFTRIESLLIIESLCAFVKDCPVPDDLEHSSGDRRPSLDAIKAMNRAIDLFDSLVSVATITVQFVDEIFSSFEEATDKWKEAYITGLKTIIERCNNVNNLVVCFIIKRLDTIDVDDEVKQTMRNLIVPERSEGDESSYPANVNTLTSSGYLTLPEIASEEVSDLPTLPDAIPTNLEEATGDISPQDTRQPIEQDNSEESGTPSVTVTAGELRIKREEDVYISIRSTSESVNRTYTIIQEPGISIEPVVDRTSTIRDDTISTDAIVPSCFESIDDLQPSEVQIESSIVESIETCHRLSREIIRQSVTLDNGSPVIVGNTSSNLVHQLTEPQDVGEFTGHPNVLFSSPYQSESVAGGDLEVIESVLSHCSSITNVCLITGFKEYRGLVPTIQIGNLTEVCISHGTEILNQRQHLNGATLRLLTPIIIDMCHSATLRLCREVHKLINANLHTSDTVKAVVTVVQIFEIVTNPVVVPIEDKFLLYFCNVVIHCLSLNKSCFSDTGLYKALSRLISMNALKQPSDVIFKLLLIMIELDVQSLVQGELGPVLLSKLRFTKILQCRLLSDLKESGLNLSVDYSVLERRNKVFIKKLEDFSQTRPIHNINHKLDQVMQYSNTLLRTIEIL